VYIAPEPPEVETLDEVEPASAAAAAPKTEPAENPDVR
jgi:hypothetical protein